MIRNDRWIKKMAKKHKMIEPFHSEQIRNGLHGRAISYGLSSYGYDIRVAGDFKVFDSQHPGIINPKNFDEEMVVENHFNDYCIVPANSVVLARSVERFRIPRNTLAICVGKSTYARCGIIVNVTPLEPTWEGILTIEISNTTKNPAMIHVNEGIAQLLFFKGRNPMVAYADRRGKYQNQSDVTLPKM